MSRSLVFGVVIAAIALVLGSSSLFIVNQAEQALVLRFGAHRATIKEPGLHAKLPFIEDVVRYDIRLLSLDPPDEQIILGDQKRIVVDTFTRFLIADPLKFYQAVRTEVQARAQMTQIVSSAMRRVMGQVMLPSILSDERARIMEQIQHEVAERSLREMGIQVVDVRLRRADLPDETSQSIYDRMKSERERQAKEARAQGYEWSQQIRARADRERTVLLAEAQRQAQIERGQGDAEANRIFAEAFGKDPQFFTLYRSLQAYREALGDGNTTLVLSPDNEFLKAFGAGPARRGQ
ncbi:membrane protease subunit stomatin/prohibitin-like protein [Paramagnetospirillum caucaseum]|uniref:Protein HflC n=1 Tax=Paramagnetospirillum caucaseum TaxID=1244869 RepID=M2Y7P9_9PROT|nr:protease modulator HflC [Paramagnetospirillum caucaseum]EME69076.1 membrane protease subunit stomatin/prohibitin-like protein [Paramagnetospirillum caucaseum]